MIERSRGLWKVIVRMRFCALVGVAGLLGACAPAVRHFPPEAKLAALLQERVRDRRAVGIAVGVLEADGTTTTAFAGDAGAGAGAPGGRTGFEIGSITKTFTGVLLADMVRTGEVRFDDPVSRYLPHGVRVPSRNGREITLLDLATNHSGLPGMPDNLSPADHTNPYADYSVEQMYGFVSGHRLRSDPGTSYEYSNIGFGLLGHALERAANSPYEDLVRARILAPLGMDGTAIELRGGQRDRMARGHNNRGFVVPYWDLPTIAGAGAFRSSMDDLLRYLAANVRAPKSGLDRSIHVTHQPQHAVSDSAAARTGTNAMGMGWQIRTVGNRRIVWKDGGTAGFQTFIGFDPERRVGVVVLSNTAIEVDDVGFHLIEPSLPLGAPPPIPRPVDVPASVLERYVGEYAVDPDISIVVSREGGTLFFEAFGEERAPLFAESENRFFPEAFDARITFIRGAAGAVDDIVLRAGGREMPGRRVR
ncbi:MAG: serine hydrolase [Gemmatimonadota bacterium]